jgi:hypothetical protein
MGASPDRGRAAAETRGVPVGLRYVRSAANAWVLTAAVLFTGCDQAVDVGESPVGAMCVIPPADIYNGGPGKDGIPALNDPTLVTVDEPGTGYLLEDERVIGLSSPEGPIAIPLQIMWWHEIVNITVDGRDLAVTHCPLTGSSLAFDRGPLGGVEFGVSGLLYQNNLIMYDRSTNESLWPQMSRGARCGSRVGLDLTMVPVVEMTWGGWRELNPDTRVISSDTGHSRDYRSYPYGNYDFIDNPNLLFPQPSGIDTRRLPKERVLGVPGIEGGLAYPFGELELAGQVAAIEHDGEAAAFGLRVVFWDAASQAAALYERMLDGVNLTFQVSDDVIVDLETGSEWRVDGLSTSGPLEGRRLEPVAEAYVAYWFAWATFESRTLIWSAP